LTVFVHFGARRGEDRQSFRRRDFGIVRVVRIVDARGMVTVHRELGLRFVIYTTDHVPAHVHVIGEGEAKILLVGRDGAPELVYNQGLKTGDIRKAMRIVAERHAILIARWRAMHG